MPVILVGAAASRELYEAVSSRIDMRTDRPDGLILHAAGEEADGLVRVVTVWETEAHARAFERERLLPAMDSAAGGRPAGAEPTVLEPFDYVA